MQFNLFPQSVFDKEEQFYQTNMNVVSTCMSISPHNTILMQYILQYGIPLDDRHNYTKTDWQMWVAAMGTQQQFQSITDHIYMFANETPDRVPFTDWYGLTLHIFGIVCYYI